MSKQNSTTTKETTSKQLEYNNFYEWQLSTTKELAGAGVLSHALRNIALPATATAQEQRT